MIGRSMMSMMAGPAVGVINLSGTPSVPNSSFDFDVTPGSVSAGWYFRTDGSVDYAVFGSITEFNPTPDEWHDPNGSPSATYYIRATSYSGDAPDGGSAMNTVLALSSDRSWTWTRSIAGSEEGVIYVEIFSDAGGVTLLADGYYKGLITLDNEL